MQSFLVLHLHRVYLYLSLFKQLLQPFIVRRSSFKLLLLLFKNIEKFDSLVLLVLNSLFKYVRAIVVFDVRSFKDVFAVGALHVDFRALICQMFSQLFDSTRLIELAFWQRASIFHLG